MNSILMFSLILLGAFFVFMIIKKTKLRYKLLILVIVALLLFGYFSVSSAFEGQKIDVTDFKGVSSAVGIYFSWLSSSLGNAQAITSKAVENNSEKNYLE